MEFMLNDMRYVMCCLILCGMMVCSSAAQEKKDPKKTDLLDLLGTEKTTPSFSATTGIALESIVDPEQYFVGPSDVIAVSIWMSPPQNYPLTVTPEGTLIIPTVGEVMVADLSLAKAKKKIVGEIRKKYLIVEVTATLVKPRPIVVSVVGNVLSPGLFTVNAVDRANRAIDDANKPSKTQEDDAKRIQETMSTRNILLKRRDGSQVRVDLQKYFATREGKLNPYLREGDIIVVPKIDPLKNVFAVYGQFNTNGRFEYVEGDSLLDAIKIANGLTSRALADRAIFSRLSSDATVITSRDVNLTEIMAGREPNIALEPGDRLVVNAKEDLREDFNVDLKGEVRFPGTYPITRNRTKLSEIIQQAGGFTEFASLGTAEVARRSVVTEEVDRDRVMNMRGAASSSDTGGYGFESGLRPIEEAVVVDFRKLFEQRDSTQDIILQREDQIYVPSRRKTVFVFGQVVSPGHVPIIEGKEPRYYIEKAGGFTDHASRGDMKIIKSKTKQWLKPGETKLEEGDNLWVPADVDHPFSYYTTIASQMATVLSVIIGLAVIIIQVRK
jgi:protein involved in polysaccharide export with SLBB domain